MRRGAGTSLADGWARQGGSEDVGGGNEDVGGLSGIAIRARRSTPAPVVCVERLVGDVSVDPPTDLPSLAVVLVEHGDGAAELHEVEHQVSSPALCVSEAELRLRGSGLRGWVMRVAGRPARATDGDGGMAHLTLRGGVYRVGAVQRARCQSFFEALDEELAGRHGGADRSAVDALIELILLSCARAAGGDPDPGERSRATAERLTCEVLEVIDRRFAERLSLADVASELARSRGSVARAVRVATGRSVLELIAERRMREACSLLAGTQLAVSEIAERVGYATLAQFHLVFRRAHGTTPQRWRAAVR